MLEKWKRQSRMDNQEKLATRQDEDKKTKNKQKLQQNMCWTPTYTRHKTKTNKTKYTTHQN